MISYKRGRKPDSDKPEQLTPDDLATVRTRLEASLNGKKVPHGVVASIGTGKPFQWHVEAMAPSRDWEVHPHLKVQERAELVAGLKGLIASLEHARNDDPFSVMFGRLFYDFWRKFGEYRKTITTDVCIPRNYEALAEVLHAREGLDLTQEQTAEKLEMPVITVHRKEKRIREFITRLKGLMGPR